MKDKLINIGGKYLQGINLRVGVLEIYDNLTRQRLAQEFKTSGQLIIRFASRFLRRHNRFFEVMLIVSIPKSINVLTLSNRV